MNFTDDIDFRNGLIIKNDLDRAWVNNIENESECNDYLKEDLLQVVYGNDKNRILDVGWYEGSLPSEALFRIFVIEASDWDNPYYSGIAYSFGELKEKLLLAVAIAND